MNLADDKTKLIPMSACRTKRDRFGLQKSVQSWLSIESAREKIIRERCEMSSTRMLTRGSLVSLWWRRDDDSVNGFYSNAINCDSPIQPWTWEAHDSSTVSAACSFCWRFCLLIHSLEECELFEFDKLLFIIRTFSGWFCLCRRSSDRIAAAKRLKIWMNF